MGKMLNILLLFFVCLLVCLFLQRLNIYQKVTELEVDRRLYFSKSHIVDDHTSGMVPHVN